jgi:hypothetical protein
MLSVGALALLLKPGHALWVAWVCTASFGVGLGFANTALLIAVQTSVEWAQRGIATASTMFFRTVGGALAIGGMGAVLAASFARDPSIPASAADEVLGPNPVRSLGPAMLQRVAQLLEGGLDAIFWMIFALTVAAFAASWFFPQVPTVLTRKSSVDLAALGPASSES